MFKPCRSQYQYGLHAPYMVKTFKIVLLQNQWIDGYEIWHAALGTRVLSKLLNDDLGLTLTSIRQSHIWIKA